MPGGGGECYTFVLIGALTQVKRRFCGELNPAIQALPEIWDILRPAIISGYIRLIIRC